MESGKRGAIDCSLLLPRALARISIPIGDPIDRCDKIDDCKSARYQKIMDFL